MTIIQMRSHLADKAETGSHQIQKLKSRNNRFVAIADFAANALTVDYGASRPGPYLIAALPSKVLVPFEAGASVRSAATTQTLDYMTSGRTKATVRWAFWNRWPGCRDAARP